MDQRTNTLEHARNTLRDIAQRIGRLSPRQQRKLLRQTGLDAAVIRNEAERCQDILTLLGELPPVYPSFKAHEWPPLH